MLKFNYNSFINAHLHFLQYFTSSALSGIYGKSTKSMLYDTIKSVHVSVLFLTEYCLT